MMCLYRWNRYRCNILFRLLLIQSCSLLLICTPINATTTDTGNSSRAESKSPTNAIATFVTSAHENALAKLQSSTLKLARLLNSTTLTSSTNNVTNSSITASTIDDLTESQSSQSSSSVPYGTMTQHDDKTNSFQQEQYRHYLQTINDRQQQQNSNSNAKHHESISALGGALSDLETRASHPLPQSSSLSLSNSATNNKQHQQPNNNIPAGTQPLQPLQITAKVGTQVMPSRSHAEAALLTAKPGQFTLISNQQTGPGHATMIGYTMPIVKIGGIIKHDQVAPESNANQRYGGSENSMQYNAPSETTSNQYSSLNSANNANIQSSFGTHAPLHMSPPYGQSQPQQQTSSLLPNIKTVSATSSANAEKSTSNIGSIASASAPVGSSDMKMLYERGSPVSVSSANSPSAAHYYGPDSGRSLSMASYRMAPEHHHHPNQDSVYSSHEPFHHQPHHRHQPSLPSPLPQPQAHQQLSHIRSAELKLSAAVPITGGVSSSMPFSAPLEKPKPFVVYKPGYLEKLKQHQANFPHAGPMMLSSPHHSHHQLSHPSSLITANMIGGGIPASFGPKYQLVSNDKLPPPAFDHAMPISELENNEITENGNVGGSSAPLSMPHNNHGNHLPPARLTVIAQPDAGAPLSTIPGSVGPTSLPSAFTPSGVGPMSMPMPFHHHQRPVSLPKQLTIDALAQQRSHRQHFKPTSAAVPSPLHIDSHHAHQPYHPHHQHQPQQLTHQPLMQHQSPSSGKIFGHPMEQSPMSEMLSGVSHSNAFETPNARKMRLLDQSSSPVHIPEPQVTSTIMMPEPSTDGGQKVDPKTELQNQINFVLQNSPNLSENSRSRHRSEIAKAVAESMANSDSGPAAGANIEQRNRFESNSGNVDTSSMPHNMGMADSLLPPFGNVFRTNAESMPESKYQPMNSRSPKFGVTSQFSDNVSAGRYDGRTSFGAANTAIASHAIPESNAFGRYSQERPSLSPPLHASPPVQSQQPQQSSGYKVKLQQEIQSYLQEQIRKSSQTPINFIASPDGPVLTLNSDGTIQQAATGQQQQPLRPVFSNTMAERSQMIPNNQQAIMYNMDSRDPRQSHQYVLGRQTEFIQGQSSQPTGAQMAAPESAMSMYLSTPSSDLSNIRNKSSPPSTASGLNLSMSSTNNIDSSRGNNGSSSSSSSSSIQPESAKTLRGYSEWWKETSTAAASANPQTIVPISTYFQLSQ